MIIALALALVGTFNQEKGLKLWLWKPMDNESLAALIFTQPRHDAQYCDDGDSWSALAAVCRVVTSC